MARGNWKLLLLGVDEKGILACLPTTNREEKKGKYEYECDSYILREEPIGSVAVQETKH